MMAILCPVCPWLAVRGKLQACNRGDEQTCPAADKKDFGACDISARDTFYLASEQINLSSQLSQWIGIFCQLQSEGL